MRVLRSHLSMASASLRQAATGQALFKSKSSLCRVSAAGQLRGFATIEERKRRRRPNQRSPMWTLLIVPGTVLSLATWAMYQFDIKPKLRGDYRP